MRLSWPNATGVRKSDYRQQPPPPTLDSPSHPFEGQASQKRGPGSQEVAEGPVELGVPVN